MNRHPDVADIHSALSWLRTAWQTLPVGRIEPMFTSGHCECGCGGRTTVPTKSYAAKGYVRGVPRRWLPGHNTVPLDERLWSKVDRSGPGCWEYQGFRDGGGRGKVFVRIGGKERSRFAHRLAWESVNGPIPDGLVVCHKCDNPPCCRPDHLFLGTIADNNRDMFAKGRASKVRARGANHPGARVTPAMSEEIRHLAREGWTMKGLAELFSLSRPTVRNIVDGSHWTVRDKAA